MRLDLTRRRRIQELKKKFTYVNIQHKGPEDAEELKLTD
jgi:hypothetical protein